MSGGTVTEPPLLEVRNLSAGFRMGRVDMLAGLLGEQRKTVGADKTNQRYFVRLRLFHPKNFFTMNYGRSKSR